MNSIFNVFFLIVLIAICLLKKIVNLFNTRKKMSTLSARGGIVLRRPFLNESVNYKHGCRTAPATPGLLNMLLELQSNKNVRS